MNQEKTHKMLVVDDEVEICNFVKMFFEYRGFEVFRAHNGNEAVSLAEKHKPHVVLLDVNMKNNESGLLVLPRLLGVSPTSKIIMTTGVDDDDIVQKAKELGALGYITKPLVLEDLEKTVSHHVRSK